MVKIRLPVCKCNSTVIYLQKIRCKWRNYKSRNSALSATGVGGCEWYPQRCS